MFQELKATPCNWINNSKNENKDGNLKLEVLFSSDEGTKTNEGDVFIEADRNRLYQVVSNLVSNAIKFTKEGAILVSIEIKARGKTKNSDNESGVDVVVSVRDPRQGIDPEIMPRLFTKFATKSDIGGTGLGLFISKSIVEAHGGKVWAENNADGKGATFSFSLPLSKL